MRLRSCSCPRISLRLTLESTSSASLRSVTSMPEAIFHLEVLPPIESVDVGFQTVCGIVGVDTIHPASPHFLPERVPGKAEPLLIKVCTTFVIGGHPYQNRCAVRHQSKACFTLLQFLHGMLVLLNKGGLNHKRSCREQ